MDTKYQLLMGALVVLTIAGCGSSAPKSAATTTDPAAAAVTIHQVTPAEEFLGRSMDAYKALKSFSAECTWTDSLQPGAKTMQADRTISYEGPNKFRVEAKHSQGFSNTSISDGRTMIEFVVGGPKPKPAAESQAPDSIATAGSMQLEHPLIGGSPLYKFFGGASHLSDLVNLSNGDVSFGPDEKVSRETASHVLFYAMGPFGHTDVLIGKSSGKVYRIAYDGEPFMVSTNEMLQRRAAQMGTQARLMPNSMNAVEAYSDVKFNPTLKADLFVAKAPAGQKVWDLTKPQGQAPTPGHAPVAIGSLAPDFTLKLASGASSMTLSKLRGHPVLIDFWATWCSPCMAEMPDLVKACDEFKKDGLEVVTISTEKPEVINKFVKQKNYPWISLADPDITASRTYNAGVIPTTVFIDKEGRLQAYLVGIQDGSAIRAALKKIGIG